MQTPSQPPLSRFGRLANFFGLKRNLVVLLIAIFVIGAGEELWMRFIPKYLQAVGATVFVIGLYDALRTLLGAIYAYPGGVFTDLWGHRRAFIIFNAVSILGYALVLFVPHWAAVIAGMFLFLSWTCFSLPATFSLIGAALEANRHSMGVGVQSVIKRLPIMIAPFFGGILIDRFGIINGVRIALIVSVFFSAVTIFAQVQVREEPKKEVRCDRWTLWRSLREFNSPMRRLLLSDILIRFCERIPYAWVVIFAMDYIGMSGQQVGILTTIEMLAAILCIIPVSYYADRHGREPFVIVTFIMFTLFPISLLVSRSFSALVVAFVIRGLKEFGEPSREALIIGYSELDRRGQVIGSYYLVRDLVVSVGAILGAYLWKLGPALNFLGAAAFGAAGTIFYVKTIRQGRQLALNELKKQLEIRRTRWK
ncbi:MAG TPA: MFS transporter [Candidatus Dormibacteraeota bacterium]|nr:MFS transporter [Candidatus Dormibacteraeota bacterium]